MFRFISISTRRYNQGVDICAYINIYVRMRISTMEKIYQLCDIICNASYIKLVYLHILLFTRTYLEKFFFFFSK